MAAGYFLAALVMISVMLLTLVVSVGGPGTVFRLFGRPVEGPGGFLLLVWGGLREGISVAMVLSPSPGGQARPAAGYICRVASSILIQGTTIPALLRQTLPQLSPQARARNCR